MTEQPKLGKPNKPNVLRFFDLAGNRIAEHPELARAEPCETDD